MARNSAGTLSQIDRLAELLAQSAGTAHDGDVPWLGRQLGLDMKQANDVMQRLRKRMGAQAR